MARMMRNTEKMSVEKKIRFEVKLHASTIDTEIEIWRDSKRGVSGCFEFYDVETNGEDTYAEGGLWFEEDQNGLTLVDYDGVYELPMFILEKLSDEFGVNVEEHLDI